jgi:hypothetical protein
LDAIAERSNMQVLGPVPATYLGAESRVSGTE